MAAKRIDNPVETARAAAGEYASVYGEDVVSVVLYGSAAGGDFDPVRSDINLLVVLKELSLAAVARSGEVQKRLRKRRFDRPLFMDRDYITRSLDSFPIEFLNMKGCYRVLHGEDVLAGLEIRSEDVRLQVERELKGKRLHLVEEWLDARTEPKRLKELLGVSLQDFGAAFRAMIHLREREIPRNREALFEAVEEAYGLEGRPLRRVIEAYRSGDRNLIASVFDTYEKAIARLIHAVDVAQSKEDT